MNCSRWSQVHTRLPGEAKQLEPFGRGMRLWSRREHRAWPDTVPLYRMHHRFSVPPICLQGQTFTRRHGPKISCSILFTLIATTGKGESQFHSLIPVSYRECHLFLLACAVSFGSVLGAGEDANTYYSLDLDCCPKAHVPTAWYQVRLLENGGAFRGVFSKRSKATVHVSLQAMELSHHFPLPGIPSREMNS